MMKSWFLEHSWYLIIIRIISLHLLYATIINKFLSDNIIVSHYGFSQITSLNEFHLVHLFKTICKAFKNPVILQIGFQSLHQHIWYFPVIHLRTLWNTIFIIDFCSNQAGYFSFSVKIIHRVWYNCSLWSTQLKGFFRDIN